METDSWTRWLCEKAAMLICLFAFASVLPYAAVQFSRFSSASWFEWMMEGSLVGVPLALAVSILLVKPALQVYRWSRLATSQGVLEGKVILVTGASSGIGAALAKQLHQAGAKLILAARGVQRLEEIKKELEEGGGNGEAAVLSLDLEDVGSLGDKAKEAMAIWGRIDILVNNGGVSVRGGALETEMEVHRKVMDINYFGAVELCRQIVPSMTAGGSGMVVMVSSVQGRLAVPLRSAYAASKHAIQAFSDCLRAEVSSRGVAVLVVSPGYVNTQLSKNALTEDGRKHGKMDETTERGYQAEHVAEKIIESIQLGDSELLLCPILHRIAIQIRAFVPPLYFYIMNRRAKKINSC